MQGVLFAWGKFTPRTKKHARVQLTKCLTLTSWIGRTTSFWNSGTYQSMGRVSARQNQVKPECMSGWTLENLVCIIVMLLYYFVLLACLMFFMFAGWTLENWPRRPPTSSPKLSVRANSAFAASCRGQDRSSNRDTSRLLGRQVGFMGGYALM